MNRRIVISAELIVKVNVEYFWSKSTQPTSYDYRGALCITEL